PPPYNGTFLPLKPNLVFTNDPTASESVATVLSIADQRVYKKVQTLFKLDKDVEEPKKKRVADERLLQESFKKLRVADVSGSESTQEIPSNDPKEMTEDDVQNILEIIPDSEVPSVDEEKALWVELKRLFEPDADDVLWKLQSNPSSNPTPSTNLNPKGRNRRRSKQRIEEFNLDELSPPILMMADQHTMAQLLQSPTEGYEDAIVVPAITADNFELKHAIIESKSKVRYSRNKPVVAKVSTNTSTSGISPDVVELKDMVKALLLDMKSQHQAPATVKTVEESCVACGGAHSYYNPATDGNAYRDNIQEFVSQASTVNYNQENTSYRPLLMSN
nr:hypothetical protein [Tanacetum cinerariifolium]